MIHPRVRIHTLGCKVNQCDSDDMAHALAVRGYDLVGRGIPADICIVNTCTVTATADAKARKLIRKLARENPQAVLIVTGCWAQRDPEAIASLPEADAVVPNTRKAEIPDILAKLQPTATQTSSPPARHRTRAFLKIQDGCDHRCAYCIVPHVRSRPTSKPMPELLQQIRELEATGVKELVLCGIRLGAYGRGGDASLAGLLHELRGIDIPRLRLSSLEPMDLDDDLLAEIADHPTLCHHLHLPLQSGDDDILAAMDRGYAPEDFAYLVSRIRATWPDAALTTDVMVAFPGETERQFGCTADFLREAAFSRVHVFPYSPRPGTLAGLLRDQIPAHTKRDRTQRMLTVARGLARAAARAWVEQEVSVLFEQRENDGRLAGLTEHYVRLRCHGPTSLIGRILEVVPESETEGELTADLCSNRPRSAASRAE